MSFNSHTSIVIAVYLFGGLTVIAALLIFPPTRSYSYKIYCILRNTIAIDIGIGGVCRFALIAFFIAAGAALSAARLHDDAYFDIKTFVIVFFGFFVANFLINIINGSLSVKRVLGPRAGHVWRTHRNTHLTGIIQKIDSNLTSGNTDVSTAKQLITEILDITVLHISDYRGSIKIERKEVFANFLLQKNDMLVVAARDRFSGLTKYKRETPKEYDKSSLLCGRAMSGNTTKSIGLLTDECPEGPQNKPYKSILAIPIYWPGSEAALGALSVDCSKPYFFTSFRNGFIENDLENSLLPYIKLIVLICRQMISHDKSEVVQLLTQGTGVDNV